MRFICLHGVGSSGSICEAQFKPIVQAVDPSYEFVFVDGPIDAIRGPGMGAQFDGPFFSHTTGYTPAEMASALSHFEEVLEDLGPFDGVVGFSQGAALAISFMYDQQIKHGRVPFRVALFFSAVFAFSPDEQYCGRTMDKLCARGLDLTLLKPGDELPEEVGELDQDERVFVDAATKVLIPLQTGGALHPDYDMAVYSSGANASTAPRLLLPQLLSEKIRLPTVHMHGKSDASFMQDMSLIARGLFDSKMMKVMEHSGSHEPPQKDAEIKKTVRALEWVVSTAGRLGRGQ